jgi:lipopolysaccharide export system protein LptA
MKRFFFLSLLTLNIAWMPIGHAETADKDQPTNIDADRMVYDDVRQVNTFSGNVVVTRGTLTMKASKVVISQDPAGYQFATLYGAPDSLATFRQKRDGGPDLWVDGEAERIEYDGKADMVKLFSKAKMRRLEGSKVTDEVEGEFISYDNRAEFFSVNNTANGQSKSGAGRIKAIIQPRVDQKGGQ